jgi:hypothetical protein
MILLNSWRRMRRAAHEALTKKSIQNYHPIQMKEATILVSSLLTPSANLKQDGHYKRLAASTIMSIVYDYPTILSEHDHAVEGIEKFNDRIGHAVTMGSYFVDIFPWMKHIPERSWLSFLCLIVDTNGQTDVDSQNGSEKVYDQRKRTLRCSEAFSIVLEMTLYVLISNIWYSINRQQRPTGETGQVSACL